MWIISNMEDCIVNTDHIADIYCIGTDVVALIANNASKSTVVLGRYNGSDQSRCALNYLFRNLGNVTKTLQMPSTEEMRALVSNGNKKWHHATGKKTKGHGGS